MIGPETVEDALAQDVVRVVVYGIVGFMRGDGGFVCGILGAEGGCDFTDSRPRL